MMWRLLLLVSCCYCNLSGAYASTDFRHEFNKILKKRHSDRRLFAHMTSLVSYDPHNYVVIRLIWIAWRIRRQRPRLLQQVCSAFLTCLWCSTMCSSGYYCGEHSDQGKLHLIGWQPSSTLNLPFVQFIQNGFNASLSMWHLLPTWGFICFRVARPCHRQIDVLKWLFE